MQLSNKDIKLFTEVSDVLKEHGRAGVTMTAGASRSSLIYQYLIYLNRFFASAKVLYLSADKSRVYDVYDMGVDFPDIEVYVCDYDTADTLQFDDIKVVIFDDIDKMGDKVLQLMAIRKRGINLNNSQLLFIGAEFSRFFLLNTDLTDLVVESQSEFRTWLNTYSIFARTVAIHGFSAICSKANEELISLYNWMLKQYDLLLGRGIDTENEFAAEQIAELKKLECFALVVDETLFKSRVMCLYRFLQTYQLVDLPYTLPVFEGVDLKVWYSTITELHKLGYLSSDCVAYFEHYTNVRLDSAVSNIAPVTKNKGVFLTEHNQKVYDNIVSQVVQGTDYKSGCIIQPVGTGKTHIALNILLTAWFLQKKEGKILYLVYDESAKYKVSALLHKYAKELAVSDKAKKVQIKTYSEHIQQLQGVITDAHYANQYSCTIWDDLDRISLDMGKLINLKKQGVFLDKSLHTWLRDSEQQIIGLASEQCNLTELFLQEHAYICNMSVGEAISTSLIPAPVCAYYPDEDAMQHEYDCTVVTIKGIQIKTEHEKAEARLHEAEYLYDNIASMSGVFKSCIPVAEGNFVVFCGKEQDIKQAKQIAIELLGGTEIPCQVYVIRSNDIGGLTALDLTTLQLFKEETQGVVKFLFTHYDIQYDFEARGVITYKVDTSGTDTPYGQLLLQNKCMRVLNTYAYKHKDTQCMCMDIGGIAYVSYIQLYANTLKSLGCNIDNIHIYGLDIVELLNCLNDGNIIQQQYYNDYRYAFTDYIEAYPHDKACVEDTAECYRGYNLKEWASVWRKYRRNGTQEVTAKLCKTFGVLTRRGFVWHVVPPEWVEMYERVVAWQKSEGEQKIPKVKTLYGRYPIGAWCFEQKQADTRGTLSAVQKQYLTNIGILKTMAKSEVIEPEIPKISEEAECVLGLCEFDDIDATDGTDGAEEVNTTVAVCETEPTIETDSLIDEVSETNAESDVQTTMFEVYDCDDVKPPKLRGIKGVEAEKLWHDLYHTVYKHFMSNDTVEYKQALKQLPTDLQHWIARERISFVKGTLSPEHEACWRKIPGFMYSMYAYKWEYGLLAMKKYWELYRTFRAKKGKGVVDGIRIGVVKNYILVQHRKGALSDEQLAELSTVGYDVTLESKA